MKTYPLILAALAALGAGCVAAPASAAPHRALVSRPDFSGVWEKSETDGRGFDASVPFDQQNPPLKPEWAEAWRTTVKRRAAGMKVWDPTIACLPPGMPRTMNATYPFEILMTPGRVTLLAEFYSETRRIWTDGRGHPVGDDLEPTFSGHSVGHWEGDTLVIDTVGLRYETVIDTASVPHSDQLHIVERVRRVKPDELEWSMVLEDPVVFIRPWSTVKHFFRAPAGAEVREYVCADNNQSDPYTPSPQDADYTHPDHRLKTLP